MKNVIAILALVSITSVALGSNLSEIERTEANEAASYGLCHELKLRLAKSDEKIIEATCGNIITTHELKIERKALLKRLNQINGQLNRLDSAIDQSP